MRQSLWECQGYSDSKGLFAARKAIMQYSQLKGIPGVTMEDIYTGNGVSELINLCMQALLNDGDEILIPSPDYPLWTATATLAGGNVVHYICDEESTGTRIWTISAARLRTAPKPSSSSTPTIPRERCIPGRFWRRSSRLPGSMS